MGQRDAGGTVNAKPFATEGDWKTTGLQMPSRPLDKCRAARWPNQVRVILAPLAHNGAQDADYTAAIG
jgi:hypothetical protein